MHGQTVFLAALRRRVNLVDRDDLAVPGVFQRQQRRNRAMFIIRFDGPVNIIRVETAICGNRHRGKHDPAKHRRAAGLVDKNVIFAAGQNFLAARTMAQHGAQIGLRAARQEQRRFLAKHRRHLVLKGIYRRIVPIDIVTTLGRHHRSAHAVCWPCHRIASHINACRCVPAGHSCIIHHHSFHHGRPVGMAGHTVTQSAAITARQTSCLSSGKCFQIKTRIGKLCRIR